MKYYLAIDIGASSGRHILSYLQDGKPEKYTERFNKVNKQVIILSSVIIHDEMAQVDNFLSLYLIADMLLVPPA